MAFMGLASLAAASLDGRSSPALLAFFGLGVSLHLLLFRLGEWDVLPLEIIAFFILAYSSATVVLVVCLPNEYSDSILAARHVAPLFLLCLAGIYISMIVYRLAFHRLRKFPGPFLSSVTSFNAGLMAAKKLRFFEDALALHEQYGDFVRINPNELSIADPRAFTAIHSTSSPCTKSVWYYAYWPFDSVHGTRDPREHDRRRKTWDRGFSAKALRGYEPRVREYADQLLERIKALEGKPVDVSNWFNLYSFDVMGKLALGREYGMIQRGKLTEEMHLLHSTTKLAGYFASTMWLLTLAKKVPLATRSWWVFHNWVGKQVHLRMQDEPKDADIFSWLLEDYRGAQSPSPAALRNLHGDAFLIIVAGSDTVAASLTCLFYQLALHQHVYQKLQAEVDAAYEQAGDEEVGHQILHKLPYLQACIDESMRLYPPVPSGVSRLTPPEGLQVGDRFVPGGSLVRVPLFTVFRDPRLFDRPNDYYPERFTTDTHVVRDRVLCNPFMTGKYSCVGKQLALMEIRDVVSQLARRYDIRLADGQTPQNFEHGLIDSFTLTTPKLRLVFMPRNASVPS